MPTLPQTNIIAVANGYDALDTPFTESGLEDYTDGMYFGDPTIPYEIAQSNQLNYLLDEIKCGPGSRILDIGCGAGTLLEEARKRGAQGIGLTLSPAQAQRCQAKGLDVRVMNYRDIPQNWNGKFDGIIANGSVEHFVNAQDALKGGQDLIYQELFEISHRLLDPHSSARRFTTTIIHFRGTSINPKALIRNPFLLPWGSSEFHCALLMQNFAFYPSRGQLEKNAKPLFVPTSTIDGTEDYRLTSEEWLRRLRKAFLSSPKMWKSIAHSFTKSPSVTVKGFISIFITESWNWQFRSKNGNPPPMQLFRHTWQAQ
ncbi:MAG: class I SAM-dependent methyltransferase [Patescibacteria group bacterium]|nr:class I SAM-dependent methyltransferase [Patescibacteria group bacterium]MDE2437895.1 class I SAM-dependent methyltransferase [Patescibacteria group bacterium]